MFNRANQPKFENRLLNKKSDGAPMVLVVDILANSNFIHPVLPIPSRIDKLFNTDISGFLTPTQRVSVSINTDLFGFNYHHIYTQALENLIVYAKSQYRKIAHRDLKIATVEKWWALLERYSPHIPSYEDDLNFCFRAYLEGFKHYKQGESEETAFLTYTDLMLNYFDEKMKANAIKITYKGSDQYRRMYKTKKGFHYPDILEYDVYDFEKQKAIQKAFIPIFIYDDLYECFSYNKQILTLKLNPSLNPEEVGLDSPEKLEEQYQEAKRTQFISYEDIQKQELVIPLEPDQLSDSNRLDFHTMIQEISLKSLLDAHFT